MASSEDEEVPLTQRPERTPPRWEGLTDEEDHDPNELEEESSSDLEGSQKVKFRRRQPWVGKALFSMAGKSEEEIQALVLQCAKDQIEPFIESYKVAQYQSKEKRDTDIFLWRRKENYDIARGRVFVYRCCMHHSRGCDSMLRVIRTDTQVIVEVKNEHHANSHREDFSKYLKHKDREAIFRAVKQNPTATAKRIRRECKPDGEIPIQHHRSVEYFVMNARKEVVNQEFKGVDLDGTISSFQQLKEVLWFKTCLER